MDQDVFFCGYPTEGKSHRTHGPLGLQAQVCRSWGLVNRGLAHRNPTQKEKQVSAHSDTLIKAQDLCRTIGRDFTNEDMTPALAEAAAEFVASYKGTNTFIPKVRGKVMSPGRARAVLNVMRQEMLGIDPPWKRKASSTPAAGAPAAPAAPRKWDCFKCGTEFPSWPTLSAHKRSCPGKPAAGGAPSAPAAPAAPYTPPARYRCFSCGESFGDDRKAWEELTDHRHAKHGGPPRIGSPVIPIRDSKLNLDLSDLPDGNYAIENPDKSSSHSHVYIKVKRTRRRTFRDRLYVWGHKTRGGEWVEPGTIEVREYSSDSKRLFGEQKPFDVYRGEHEELLQEIMDSPEHYAKLFGVKMKKCGICAKSLTDDESLKRGIGPECAKKPHYFTEKPKSYVVVAHCDDCGEIGKVVYVHRSKRDNNVTYECKNGHEWDRRVTNDDLKATAAAA